MLNADVKKQINTARDILVGKIPDPKGQIDQITNALIYKFMDDQDRLSQTLPKGKASFFVDTLESYAWHKLFDSKLSNQDRANLYIEGIEKLSKAKNLPTLFKDIFKDAFLPFRDADTIAMFLNEINKFDYHHSEDLGNAFEYLLSIMGSQGDAGQFRTPRNIIEFIVDAVNPTKDEHILDPACGTAGFLVESYKHIVTDSKLSPNEVQELAKHIHGVDIDPGMAKIARVNLYLHGFKTPLITEDDTLTNESLWGKKYDVILANPPFMTPKGGIKPHDKFSVQSKRAEVLFTDYIAEHLKLAGRAGIVVPEGIIFQSSNTYKQLRKMLVEDNYLWGVISLPAGVFNPYSGVKTSILLLDRKRASENKEIVFYKVENDGFELGAQRKENKQNDLPEALQVVENWRNGEKTAVKKALFIDKEKIAEDGDYNLSIDRYGVAIDYSNAKWPMVKLSDIFSEIKNGKNVKQFDEDGKYKVSRIQTIANGSIDLNKTKNTNDEVNQNDFLTEGDILFSHINSIDHLAKTAIFENINEKVVHGSNLIRLRSNQNKILPKYAIYVLKSDLFILEARKYAQKAVNQASINSTAVKNLEIPLPPLEIQKQIVAELDNYSRIISGAKQIVDNWKPKIDIDLEWKNHSFDSLVEITTGKLNANAAVKGGVYPFFTCSKNIYSIDSYSFDCEALLLAGNNASADYDVKYYKGKFDAYQRTYVITIKNESVILYPYLMTILEQKLPELKSKSIGNLTKYLTLGVIKDLNIFYPDIKTQKQIVEKIETEKNLVESAKELINTYEQKTKNVVDNLWSE